MRLQFEIDTISNTDEWGTWPGYLTLFLRVTFTVFFVFELSRSIGDEIEARQAPVLPALRRLLRRLVPLSAHPGPHQHVDIDAVEVQSHAK